MRRLGTSRRGWFIVISVLIGRTLWSSSEAAFGQDCPAPIELGYGLTIQLWPDPASDAECQRTTINPGEGPPSGGPILPGGANDPAPPPNSFSVVLSGFDVSEPGTSLFGLFVAREMSGEGQSDPAPYAAQDNGLGGIAGSAKAWRMSASVDQSPTGRYPFLSPLPHHTIDNQQVENLTGLVPNDGVWFHSDPRPIVLSRQWLNGVWVTPVAGGGMPAVPIDIRSDRQVYVNLKPSLTLTAEAYAAAYPNTAPASRWTSRGTR